MSDMVEKVARAICANDGLTPDALRPDDVPNWIPYVANARAALIAMREPSEKMVAAGCQHENFGDMAGRWQAMIDCILRDDQ